MDSAKEWRVKFLNDPCETKARSNIDIITILKWANEWSQRGNNVIPKFIHYSDDENSQADIHVTFADDIGSGTLTTEKPISICLNLTHGDVNFMKSNVIHQFGHALGLPHEHQRPQFWKFAHKYMDTDLIVEQLGTGNYKANIEDENIMDDGEPYDPFSIMHYWFDKKWLKDGYSDEQKILEDYEEEKISKGAKDVLLGVHVRSDGLAKFPSTLDIRRVQKILASRDSSDKQDDNTASEDAGDQHHTVSRNSSDKQDENTASRDSSDKQDDNTASQNLRDAEADQKGGVIQIIKDRFKRLGRGIQQTFEKINLRPSNNSENPMVETLHKEISQRAEGLAIIVGCPGDCKNPGIKYLGGVNQDCQRAVEFFKNLKFDIVTLREATYDDITGMIEAVRTLSDEDLECPEYKKLVFVFAGHGHKKWKVTTNDNKDINVMDQIVDKLVKKDNLSSQILQFIPKLFFIDACRGAEKEKIRGRAEVVVDESGGIENPLLPLRGNYLLAYSTMEGFAAHDSPSWLQKVFEILEHREDRSLLDKLTDVNKAYWPRDLSRRSFMWDDYVGKQQPIVISTLHDIEKLC